MPNRYDLQIADVAIRLETELQLPPEDAFLPFLIPCREPDVRCEALQVEKLPPLPEKLLAEAISYRVYEGEKGGYVRSFFNGERDPEPYASAFYDQDCRSIRILYTQKGASYLNQLSNCIFCMGLEGIMMGQKKVCFHAALIRSAAGGILFSGPSGIGKSTQADLWCSEEQARLINGDRPILGLKNGVWTGFGSPYAGSSHCHLREEVPLSAIVFLSQSAENTVEKLPVSEAFRRIYAQLTVNLWNPRFPLFAFETAVSLAENLPVYHLSCTKDARAVRCLKERLRKDLMR